MRPDHLSSLIIFWLFFAPVKLVPVLCFFIFLYFPDAVSQSVGSASTVCNILRTEMRANVANVVSYKTRKKHMFRTGCSHVSPYGRSNGRKPDL